MNFEEVKEFVKNNISEKRFYHSICVVKRCEELAKIYNADMEKVRLVAIIHDVAKEMEEYEKIKYVEENNLPIDDVERNHPNLLHGKIAGDIAKKKFGFTEDMISAITFHTTGKANMSLLDKILYVADATGDDRGWDDLEYVKKLPLDDAVMYILNMEIADKVKEGKLIHVNSIMARNYMLING